MTRTTEEVALNLVDRLKWKYASAIDKTRRDCAEEAAKMFLALRRSGQCYSSEEGSEAMRRFILRDGEFKDVALVERILSGECNRAEIDEEDDDA